MEKLCFLPLCHFQSEKKNPDYILNRVFSNAFLCFVVFVLGDAIAFLIAPQNYTTYIIARVIYGVGYALLFTYAFLMLNAALIIRHSERILDNKKLLRIEVLILVIFLAVFLFNAKITILDANNNPIDPHNFPPLVNFRMTEGLAALLMIATIIPFFYYGIAAIS